QQVGLSSSVQVQAALDKVARKRLVVQREERDRVREAIGLQSLLQGGDALTHIGAVPPPAARVRPVVKVNALQPDDAASGGATGDLAQLRRGRERLSIFLRVRPPREDLLHAEDPAAD